MTMVSVTFDHDESEFLAGALAETMEMVQMLGVRPSTVQQSVYTKMLAAHAVVCPSSPTEELVENLDFIATEKIPVSVVADPAETGNADHV